MRFAVSAWGLLGAGLILGGCATVEIRDTRISIERFEKICQAQGYQLALREHYLLNPIYEWKFGWKPRLWMH